jgi:hypothetical protein
MIIMFGRWYGCPAKHALLRQNGQYPDGAGPSAGATPQFKHRPWQAVAGPIDAPCTQFLRHGDPMHAHK